MSEVDFSGTGLDPASYQIPDVPAQEAGTGDGFSGGATTREVMSSAQIVDEILSGTFRYSDPEIGTIQPRESLEQKLSSITDGAKSDDQEKSALDRLLGQFKELSPTLQAALATGAINAVGGAFAGYQKGKQFEAAQKLKEEETQLLRDKANNARTSAAGVKFAPGLINTPRAA